MKQALKLFFLSSILIFFFNCKPEVHREYIMEPCPDEEKKIPVTQQIKQLKEKGFEIFDYIDEKTGDTIVMQQYFIAFLKRGANRSQTKEAADSLQKLHRAHLERMYEEGYADISGPFGDDGDIRGITIYNVPTFKIADSLANIDPMVKSGRLTIEMRPWWAVKGFSLR